MPARAAVLMMAVLRRPKEPDLLAVELPGLLDNELLGRQLNLSLQRLPGIHRAEASAATGQLLLEHDERLNGAKIFELLNCLSACCLSLDLGTAFKLEIGLLLGLQKGASFSNS